jgi:hypothetical protein
MRIVCRCMGSHVHPIGNVLTFMNMPHKRELLRYIPWCCTWIRETRAHSTEIRRGPQTCHYQLPCFALQFILMKFQLKYPTKTTTLIVLTVIWFYYAVLDNVCLDVSEEWAASIFTFSHPKDWGSKPLQKKNREKTRYTTRCMSLQDRNSN